LSKSYLLTGGICLKPKAMFKNSLSQFPETLPLSEGKILGGQRLMIDLYPCMPGGAPPTTGVATTCDNAWTGSALLVNVYEKTVNVKFYDFPVNSAHREFDRIIPATGLRFSSEITIKWVELWTDVGTIAKDWTLQSIVTMKSFLQKTSEKSAANIPRNFLSQGKIIMSDFHYHTEIASSNEKTEIYRYYYTVIDVFAAVGGL